MAEAKENKFVNTETKFGDMSSDMRKLNQLMDASTLDQKKLEKDGKEMINTILDDIDWTINDEDLAALGITSEDGENFTSDMDMSSLEQVIDDILADSKLSDILAEKLAPLEKQINAAEQRAVEIHNIMSSCNEKIGELSEAIERDMASCEVKDGAVEEEEDDDDVQFVGTSQADPARPSVDPNRSDMVMITTTDKDGQAIRKLVPMSQIRLQNGEPLTTANIASLQQLQAKQPPPPGGWSVTQVPPPKLMYPSEGSKVYGRKKNNIWFKGVLVDIQQQNRPQAKYKIKYDNNTGVKVVDILHLATPEPPTQLLPVGTRVIAVFKDADPPAGNYYAGVVAESPSDRNNRRYLVFFDDGYAQYCMNSEIRQVYKQSDNVWEDIHPDSQEFIKSYLKQYPERPMVRLQKGQTIKTEWNGDWWSAKVDEVDASLVKMYFDADKGVEWIYRGSTRLEPLYTELRNAEASKVAGRHGRRVHMQYKRPMIEYTRGDQPAEGQPQQNGFAASQPARPAAHPAPPVPGPQKALPQPVVRQASTEPVKTKNVARKSTGGSANVGHMRANSKQAANPERPGPPHPNVIGMHQRDNRDAMGTVQTVPYETRGPRKKYVAHQCSRECMKTINNTYDPVKYLTEPMLRIPIKLGFKREITRSRGANKRSVFYRAPCTRRLRTLDEMENFLWLTDSQLTIDQFSFDFQLHTHNEFVPVSTFCDIKDISYGKETVPISCVNGIDRHYPDYVEYSNIRVPAQGVNLNTDEDFLVGCGCTDGCRDRTKCACIQETIEASACNATGRINPNVGYRNRILETKAQSGIYECNSKCKCDHRCGNRVAQNGLRLRLQVFKTERRGWGLRCLDDIPAGGFICIYAGQLLTDTLANEDGQQYGDEYLAELDYIEVCEQRKDDYESDVDLDEAYASDGESNYDSDYSDEKRKQRTKKW